CAGDIGATLDPAAASDGAHAFGEDQGRYLAATTEPDVVAAAAAKAGVACSRLGAFGGDVLTVDDRLAISVLTLRAARERWMPAFMG
ncbi:MAG: phosphoribosylformylglycinamidine synthase II, partial [Pseudomonadota bacterium]